MSPTVYVVQEPPRSRRDGPYKYDISKAAAWGELYIVLSWSEARRLDPYYLAERLATRLQHFTAADALLLIGSPTVMAAAVAAVWPKMEQLRLLVHERKTNTYEEVILQKADFVPGGSE